MTQTTTSAKRRPGRPATPPEVRFRRLVDERGDDECWPWLGTAPNGHGEFRIAVGQKCSAQAFAALLGLGYPPPPGQEAQHTCRTALSKLCCNPGHLRYGKPGKNQQPQYGERHHSAKLTDADVVEIRHLVKAKKHTQTAVAQRFGVSQGHVSFIVQGKRRAA
jgi:hypothetical protein